MGHFAAQHSMLAKYFTKSRKWYLLFLCRGGRAQFGGLGGRLLARHPGPTLRGVSPRAAHRDLVDAQRRLADPHRHPLTVLAAGAAPVVERAGASHPA